MQLQYPLPFSGMPHPRLTGTAQGLELPGDLRVPWQRIEPEQVPEPWLSAIIQYDPYSRALKIEWCDLLHGRELSPENGPVPYCL